jgi:TfoX/Sxy family transcriptional regulator of competence genes
VPFTRADEQFKEFFTSVLPDDPRVKIRPMVGNLAGFINGNMFTGLYGQQVFVRLSDTEREQLLAEDGASVFSPMKGRPMKEYVTFPEQWLAEPDKVRHWIVRSLNWVEAMPEKVSKKQSVKKSKKEK